MNENSSLLPIYTHGTHCLAPPEQTLARIRPHLPACGITRCAEVTGLDVDLGVPTFCAIRPAALVLQTANGKGLTRLSAKVSALMEAIELHHAENPVPERLRRVSLNELTRLGLKTLPPERLPAYTRGYFSADYRLDWTAGVEALAGEPVWVPASAVYFCEPALFRTSTNGLASGNHPLEAALHALYELIERDALAGLEVEGRLKIKEKCKIIDLATITDVSLQAVIRKIQQAKSKLVLLWLPSCIPVHTCWAVLLNQAPFSPVSTFNAGCGTHLDLAVAVARAITEAVQSRLTLVHGSREDIIAKPVYRGGGQVNTSPAYAYFDQDLGLSYRYLLAQLAAAGRGPIFCFDLTRPDMNIPVVKVIMPSLRFNRKLV
jgi:ribosomal protein S12 methylthiotransferase accessory factor